MIHPCQRCGLPIATDHCLTCGHIQVSTFVFTYRDVARIAKHTVLNVMNEHDGSHGNSWINRKDDEDIEHMIKHLAAFKAGDRSEDHVGHTLVRAALIMSRKAGD